MAQAEGSASARRTESGAASPSGRPGERQLRVQAHGCMVREFTELRVVQELNAHNGAPTLSACAIHQPATVCRGAGSSFCCTFARFLQTSVRLCMRQMRLRSAEERPSMGPYQSTGM